MCRLLQATCTDFDTMLDANTGLKAKLAGRARNAKCRQVILPTPYNVKNISPTLHRDCLFKHSCSDTATFILTQQEFIENTLRWITKRTPMVKVSQVAAPNVSHFSLQLHKGRPAYRLSEHVLKGVNKQIIQQKFRS